jgi:hypothetical protein
MDRIPLLFKRRLDVIGWPEKAETWAEQSLTA